MALLRQHGSVIAVSGGNVKIDAEVAGGLPANEKVKIELGVIGFANFLSGNYQQKTTDVNDVVSTVTVDSAKVKNATFSLLTTLPADSGATFSTYGDAVKATGSKLVIQNKSAILDSNGSGTTVLSSAAPFFGNLRGIGNLANIVDGTTLNIHKVLVLY